MSITGAPTVAVSTRSCDGASAIGQDEAHAWIVDLDEPVVRPESVLDDAERDRARRYLSPQDGARFAVSRAAARLILASYLGCDPARLQFGTDPAGRPTLARATAGRSASQCRAVGGRARPASLDFSLARSGGLAVVAVSARPVGADIERITARAGLADLAAARFAVRERACIAGGCHGSRLRGFYVHWTVKEAYLKAIGIGLAGLRCAELSCKPSPVLWYLGEPAVDWTLSLIDVSAAHVAAVVATRPVTACCRLAP